MKSGKAPEVNGIACKMLKAGGATVIDWFAQVANVCMYEWIKGIKRLAESSNSFFDLPLACGWYNIDGWKWGLLAKTCNCVCKGAKEKSRRSMLEKVKRWKCWTVVDIFVSKKFQFNNEKYSQVKEKSAIREHALSCGVSVNIKNFKILESSNNKLSLLISESLYIKKLKTLSYLK